MVRPVDRPDDVGVDAAVAGEQTRGLELEGQRGERVGEHVVHLPGEPTALGRRRGLGLRRPRGLELVALLGDVVQQPHGEEPWEDSGQERPTRLANCPLTI